MHFLVSLDTELGNTTLMNLLANMEKESQNVIINKRMMKYGAGSHIRMLLEHMIMKWQYR